MEGMIFAGIVTIAHSRNERWDQIRQWNAVERYRRLWFNTTFALELDHLILFRAKDVYSRALYDTKEGNKDAKEIYKTFEYQLKKMCKTRFGKEIAFRMMSRGKTFVAPETFKVPPKIELPTI